MIVIDGTQTEMQVGAFTNLEEILVKAIGDETMQDRVVTDVLVNDEPFSEIYPHQAEDIEASEIASVEIRSVPVQEMAIAITNELEKVVDVMATGSRHIAELFRQADDTEALEMYQDLLQVVRDFLGMVGVLRNDFGLEEPEGLAENVEIISDLFVEVTEVMENEDWILLADLLEYEFLPAVELWKGVVVSLRQNIRETVR